MRHAPSDLYSFLLAKLMGCPKRVLSSTDQCNTMIFLETDHYKLARFARKILNCLISFFTADIQCAKNYYSYVLL